MRFAVSGRVTSRGGAVPSATVQLSGGGGGDDGVGMGGKLPNMFMKEVIADKAGLFDVGILRGGGYQISVNGVGADAHGVPLSLVQSVVQFEVTDGDITPAVGLHMCHVIVVLRIIHVSRVIIRSSSTSTSLFQTIVSLFR